MTRMIEWIVSSAALLAVLILLRQVLKGKIGLRLQYALWGLALLRLLVPVSFGSTAVSVQNALPAEAKSVPQTVTIRSEALLLTEHEKYIYSLPAQWEQYETKRQELKEAGETVNGGIHSEMIDGLPQILTGIWIIGMAAVALCLFGSNLRFALRLRKSRKLLREEGLPVYITDAADTPCLFGLFRPAIYVTPEAAEEEGRLRHVIQHELTHYRHADHLWSFLRGVCLILHWYNPLVWWGAVLSRRDCELACDEATIRRLGEGERAAYGRTLIYMTCLKRPALLVTATTMTGSKGSIKERIALIVKKPKTAVFTLIAVLLAAAVAVGCTFTGAKTQETPEPTATPAEAPATSAPTPAPTGAEEPTDEWFMEEAQKAASAMFLQVIGREPTTGEPVVRRSEDGQSVEVGLRALGRRYFMNVDFHRGEDGNWALPGDGDVMLYWEDRDQEELRLDLGEQTVPEPVAQYALEVAQLELDYYELSCGYYFDDARITAVTRIDTGTVGNWDGYNLYRVEWRFRPAAEQEIMLAGGMTMEDGCITEHSSAGQPYILMGWRESNGVVTWERICVTNTDVIKTEYGTPEMLEKYGNAYTAAAVELRSKARSGQSVMNPLGFSVASPSSSPAMIGQDWADAFTERLIHAPEDDPNRCEKAEVRKCEFVAESLLGEPKTYVYSLELACVLTDETELNKARDTSFVEWGEDTMNPGWVSILFFIVLDNQGDGGWRCVQSSLNGSWGYLNYYWNTDELLDRIVTEQVGGEDALMLLPLIDWADFDRQYKSSSETWNALYSKLDEACIGEGRYYDLQRSQLWSDVFSYDQLYRDMYVILGFLHSDGAYAEGLAEILKKQYAYDPIGFEQSLNCFPYQQQGTIRSALGKVKTITLNIRDFAVSIGGTYTLRASLTPVGTDAAVYWISVDPAVAAVDENGTVTGVGCGTTRIIASAGGISTECTVRVVEVTTGKVEETEPPLTVTLLYYDKPAPEKTTPNVRMTLQFDEADGISEKLRGIVDGIRFWTNDDMVDRVKFYFDGDMVFSDREYIYYFSYEQREIYYDHYFAQLSQKDVEYLKSLEG